MYEYFENIGLIVADSLFFIIHVPVKLSNLAGYQETDHYIYIHVHQSTEHAREPVNPDKDCQTVQGKSHGGSEECIYNQ